MATDMDYNYYPIEIIGDKMYMFTNFGAPKYRLLVADVSKPELKDWVELVPETENVLSGAEVIGGKLFLTYDKDVANHAYVYDLTGKMIQEIQLPSLGSVSFSGDKDDKECFFGFTSFTVPGATYKYDMDQNTYELFRAPKVAFNPDEYMTEQVFYPSKDGTKTAFSPISLPHVFRSWKMAVFMHRQTCVVVANMVKSGTWQVRRCRNKMYLTISFPLPNTLLIITIPIKTRLLS